MSDATKAALQDAILAHIADECDGDIAGGWALVAETTNVSDIQTDTSSWFVAARDYQSSIMTNGLLYSALTVNNATARD